MSPSSILYSACTFFFVAMLVLEQVVSSHQGKRRSLLRGYQGHNALASSTFFSKFFKNSDNFVETDCTSEKFFDGSSNSKKGEYDSLHEMVSRLFVQSS
jgi:hypothetical protein